MAGKEPIAMIDPFHVQYEDVIVNIKWLRQTESGLTLNVEYKCPHCANEGEATTDYTRKTFEGVASYVFECEKCSRQIGITKKLKEPKKKVKEEAKAE